MTEIQLKNKNHHLLLKVHKIRQIRSFHQSLLSILRVSTMFSSLLALSLRPGTE